MPKFFSTKVENDVKRLSKENYTKTAIKSKLKEEDIDISVSTITRMLQNIGIRRRALSQKKPVPKFKRRPIKRKPAMVNKIRQLVEKENPASYRHIKSKTSLSLRTIHKVIHNDLNNVTRKKAKVHKLTAKHKKNRKTNCRKLYENHLAGEKSEYTVTLDEALVYLNNSKEQTPICYVKRGESVPDDWVFEKDESFSKSFMIVGVITGRGTVPLIRVPAKAKVNAEYYVEYVLKPLFTVHLPRLYKNEMHKVFYHHDKATSHTAKKTTEYLDKLNEELGITYINNKDIPVKTPDGSPLDFYGFGYLKQELLKRRATTLDGVWKIAKEVWSRIDRAQIKKVYGNWKRRLRLIAAKNGEHIEQTKDIHRRSLKE